MIEKSVSRRDTFPVCHADGDYFYAGSATFVLSAGAGST